MTTIHEFQDNYAKENGYDDFDQFIHEIEDIDKARKFITEMVSSYAIDSSAENMINFFSHNKD